jgi:hypothetical protein
MLAISISMSYGIPPLSFLRELPGFSSSFNWRLISVAGFCLVVLAAMGLDRLLSVRGAAASRTLAYVAGAFAAIGVLALWLGARIWWADSQAVEEYTRAWKGWALTLFCLGAALVLVRLAGHVQPRTLALLALALLTLDMVRAHWNFNPTVGYSTFYPANALLTFAAERGPTERVAVIGRYAWANMLVPYRVPDYRLYDATISNRYMTFTRVLSPETFREAFRRQDASLTTHLVLTQPRADLLAVMGVRWLLAPLGEDPNTWQPALGDSPIYTRTLANNGFAIWENSRARPFAYFAAELAVSADEAGVLQQLREQTLEDVGTTQVEDPGNTLAPRLGAETPLTVDEMVAVQSYAPGDIQLRVTSERPRLLVVSESWSPHWRATLDGQPAPIYRANYVIQGVVVPPGEHQVRLVYDPPAFKWGVGVSLAALAGWLGLLGWSVAGMRRRGGQANGS